MAKTGWRHGLSLSLIGWFLLCSLILALLQLGVRGWLERRSVEQELSQRLERIEQNLRPRLASRLLDADLPAVQAELDLLLRYPEISYLELVTGEQILRAGKPPAQEHLEYNFHLAYNDSQPSAQAYLYLTVDLTLSHQQLKQRLIQSFWVNLLEVVLSAAFLAGLFHHRLSKPLRRMATYAEHINSEHLDIPLELQRGYRHQLYRDELDELVHSINSMRLNLKAELDERKKAEQALFEQMLFLNNVITHIPSAVFWKDRDLIYVGCNQNFAKDMGQLKPDDILGKSDFDLPWSSEDADYIRYLDRAVIDSGKGQFNVERTFRLNEREFVWLTSMVPLSDDHGNVVGVLGINTDVTEAKHRERQNRSLNQDLVKQLAAANRAEQSLKNIRNYLRSIIDSMPSVLAGVSPDGRVSQWNRAAQEATGLSTRQAIGQPLEKVLPQLAGKMDLVSQSIRERRTHKRERQLHYLDGERHMYNVIVYPLTSYEIEGAVVRVDDVTHQIRLEEMMVQTEKMMSVGGLAAGMAHEINNPLGGILQGTQNILRRLSPDLAQNRQAAEECGIELSSINRYLERRKVLQFLDNIKEAGERAAEIVTNMLNFSRRSQGAGQPYSINTLVENSVSLAAKDYDLKKRFDFRSIHVEKDYADNLPLVVCKSSEIVQVLLNLLKNAAQAMADQADACLWISTYLDGDKVCIRIRDNGPGMSEDTRQRIFEPFFTTKEVGVGTGLGLSVSYFIICNNHQGQMRVESVLGQGAAFIISLPVMVQAES